MSKLIIPQNDDNVKHRQQIALFLTKQGFSLLPLLPASKIPYLELLPSTRQGQASWSLYSLRPASESEVKDWFAFNPECNYGILTGPASIGGLYVLDVDQVKKLPKEELPPTVCVQSGRGLHYYFKHEGELPGRTFDFGELKGKNAYIVGPGSVHESGAVYRFFDMLSPADVSIAALPSWLESPARAAKPVTAASTTFKPTDLKNQEWHRTNSVTMPQRFEQLEQLNQDPEIALKVMEVCGRKVKKLGAAFPCPIPGHGEKKPSAALYHKPGRPIILHDFHEREKGRRYWPLVDVYASYKTGKALELKKGERAAWWLRCLHEIGIVSPPVIRGYDLPKGVKHEAGTVYNGFCYLLELRQLYEPADRAPFNRSFAAKWCLTDKEVIRRGMRWLLQEGYLFIIERGRPYTDPAGPALTMFVIGRPKVDK